jgi:hypothetical protein
MRSAYRYSRRFLEPVEGQDLLEFDMMTELWFADRAPTDVIEDELNLFDGGKTRFYAVSEVETDLG